MAICPSCGATTAFLRDILCNSCYDGSFGEPRTEPVKPVPIHCVECADCWRISCSYIEPDRKCQWCGSDKVKSI